MTVTIPTASVTVSTTADFTSNLSLIRSKIGDLGGLDGTGRIYLVDERINALFTLYPSVLTCSIECVKAILADIAKDADFSAGVITTNRTQAFQQFKDLLAILMTEAETSTTPYVGGVYVAQVDALNSRSDIVPRRFAIGMDRKCGG